MTVPEGYELVHEEKLPMVHGCEIDLVTGATVTTTDDWSRLAARPVIIGGVAFVQTGSGNLIGLAHVVSVRPLVDLSDEG